jgi:hypothetical protein
MKKIILLIVFVVCGVQATQEESLNDDCKKGCMSFYSGNVSPKFCEYECIIRPEKDFVRLSREFYRKLYEECQGDYLRVKRTYENTSSSSSNLGKR